jgi:tellurite resistance protein TehA-like permease
MAKDCPKLYSSVRNISSTSYTISSTSLLRKLDQKLTSSSSWFSVNMGTGIVSILLHNLPYNGKWIYWISVIMFALNAVLFCIFFALSFLRYTLYPQIWGAMIRHPAQSLFLGTFPMGLATIINMIVFVCVPAWGYRAVQLVRCREIVVPI